MNDNLDLTLYPESSELVLATATELLEIINIKLRENDECHIALTGGTLGVELMEKLIGFFNSIDDLTGLHIWFSDERFAPIDSDLRNALAIHKKLKNKTIDVHQVLGLQAGVTVHDAADSYNAELSNVTMDVCVLGLGPDAHVASLFPAAWSSDENRRAIAITDSPKPPLERVTFSMNFINSSEQVWIIAAGEAKSTAVSQVLEMDLSVPAAHAMGSELTRLIIDSEAFSVD